MPKFYELYGQSISDHSQGAINRRKQAYCPFLESTCDGGGNRHQTKIRLKQSELKNFFDPSLSTVVPGVCSISYSKETWIVCPRRLLGFSPPGESEPIINHSLKRHEREALIKAGLPRDKELGVWAEVYLQYGDKDSAINYHFDFVIAPIKRNVSFKWLLEKYDINEASEMDVLKNSAKIGKYLRGRFSLNTPLEILPDLTNPIIIEVMTASTSGSDRSAGTDIASAFTDAMMNRKHNCPGINKRQVWGRMSTQLFAKSALANYWGGKTIWLVQDQLLKNIEHTTRLDLSSTNESSNATINFLSMGFTDGELQFKSYSEIEAGLNFQGNNKATDILLPKKCPEQRHLLQSVLRRRISAILKL